MPSHEPAIPFEQHPVEILCRLNSPCVSRSIANGVGEQAGEAAHLPSWLKPFNLRPTPLGRFGAQFDVALRHSGVRDGL